VKMFNWVFTLWRGTVEFRVPVMFVCGFIATFLLGGITGIFLATFPVDWQLQDTYFVVAHLHYVLFGGPIFAILAALAYWWPKMFGKMLDERLGKLSFWLVLVGMNLTFFPMHFLGLLGMPRRIADYGAATGWRDLNALSTVGAAVLGLGVLPFLVAVAAALRRPPDQGPDPWGGATLEWWTDSPPPPGNFRNLPPIRSVRPVFDARLDAGREAPS